MMTFLKRFEQSVESKLFWFTFIVVFKTIKAVLFEFCCLFFYFNKLRLLQALRMEVQ